MAGNPRRSIASISLDVSEAVDVDDRIAGHLEEPARATGGHRVRQRVLETQIDVIDWDRAVETIMAWGSRHESRAVAMCNAHSLVTAQRDLDFRRVLEEMDMATADGMSVAWLMRRLGRRNQQRVNGPDLMWRCCQHAEREGQSVFLFGNTTSALDLLKQRLSDQFPALRFAGSLSPPFRPLTEDEERAMIEEINASGANLVFVSLGCPKQERWINANSRRVAAVVIGVGAAFEFHSGLRLRAPAWMQEAGLEWLFRLLCEPRRLSSRYFSTNASFILGAVNQLLQDRPSKQFKSGP
jgi:N-acetylglucosaminyldiphosphoundecaprenol N-acetyl-beta-D-mannosaminyltransferase